MRYIWLIVLSVLLSGCWSDGYMDVRGKVLDEKTNEPLPNRKIIVHELMNSEDNRNSSYVGEFTTDSLGLFTYKLRKSKVTYFYNFELIGDSAYGISNNKLGMTELNREGKFLIFHMHKLTDLSLKIERKSRTAFWDTLFVSWRTNKVDGELLYPYEITNYGIGSSLPLRWVGGDVKSVVKTKVFADKKTIVHWKLFRQGRSKEFTDTIFCQRGSVNSISFKY
jgi:hypothetical protein